MISEMTDEITENIGGDPHRGEETIRNTEIEIEAGLESPDE